MLLEARQITCYHKKAKPHPQRAGNRQQVLVSDDTSPIDIDTITTNGDSSLLHRHNAVAPRPPSATRYNLTVRRIDTAYIYGYIRILIDATYRRSDITYRFCDHGPVTPEDTGYTDTWRWVIERGVDGGGAGAGYEGSQCREEILHGV
ncbi:hypothetical protein ABW21_db0202133 [Orbilia brochopaga]|nr:hypothetical protein ABW21_db0202133 [Drechslerella brochopaga]